MAAAAVDSASIFAPTLFLNVKINKTVLGKDLDYHGANPLLDFDA